MRRVKNSFDNLRGLLSRSGCYGVGRGESSPGCRARRARQTVWGGEAMLPPCCYFGCRGSISIGWKLLDPLAKAASAVAQAKRLDSVDVRELEQNHAVGRRGSRSTDCLSKGRKQLLPLSSTLACALWRVSLP